jgi:microcystin degradation protein MlrC
VRGRPRPEAELAKHVRAAIGSAAFIVGTFDPHGNEDAEFLQHADMAFAGKYFPHYDSYLQGERAARCLVRAIRGDYVPTTATRKVPIISATVFQWTGASPWMDLVQRALTWEAREPDLFVNFFFGFPWSDVPDVGMTFQVLTNDNPQLACIVADDMAANAWRQREALFNTVKIFTIDSGVAAAKLAIANGAGPVVLADHSDRSGYATWLLHAVIEQGLSRTLIGTVADAKLVASLIAHGAKIGDPVDVEVGGSVDESAGSPAPVRGRIVGISQAPQRVKAHTWFHIGFGDGNVLIVSPYLAQIIEPSTFADLGIDLAEFDVFAIKSRVHFRRGFDDSGFAKAILLVEPDQPFLGTVRLENLPYQNVDLKQFYPYGNPVFPAA